MYCGPTQGPPPVTARSRTRTHARTHNTHTALTHCTRVTHARSTHARTHATHTTRTTRTHATHNTHSTHNTPAQHTHHTRRTQTHYTPHMGGTPHTTHTHTHPHTTHTLTDLSSHIYDMRLRLSKGLRGCSSSCGASCCVGPPSTHITPHRHHTTGAHDVSYTPHTQKMHKAERHTPS